MKLNPDIFKAYDIRGIYPADINEAAAYKIGRAFVAFLQGKKKTKKLNIAVGRDGRLSSPALFKELTRGIIDQGANVIDIGLSTSPMFYFGVANFNFDGGINITASHNPAKYNGFKFVREKAIPISRESGIEEIKKMVLAGKFKKTGNGRMLKKQVLKEYIDYSLKKFNLKAIKPLNIIVDTANSVSGIIIPEFFKKLNVKLLHIFSKLDGKFPNHPPEPHIEENLRVLKKQVLAKKADLGIAFDGDGDRVIFVNEKGEMIPGDLITALMIKLILKENPGEKILCDVRSSKITVDTVKNEGGVPVMGRIGHSFIKERMRKENIIFQGELNGHYYHRDYYFSEVPLLVIFKILEKISTSGKSISELIKPYNKYFFSGEICLKLKDKKRALKTLEDKYSQNGKVCSIDGLRVDYPDWWFNARLSNTESLLKLVVEANTKEMMEQRKKEIISLIS